MKEKKEESIKFVGRIVAGAYYDMQEIRISTINRIRDVVRKKKEGIEFDEVEEKKKEKDYEEKYKDKDLPKYLNRLEKEGKVTERENKYIQKCLDIQHESEKIENKYKSAMMEYIISEKIYTEFLEHIRGIGSVLSANLIKEFGDCNKYDTVAKLWANSGNSVVDGVSPKRHKGEDLHFNPRLRTMTWKISDCLMKSNKGIYRAIYNTEKTKQSARDFKEGELEKKYGKPYKKEDLKLSKGHCHNMALRKMRKLFLSHYWACARELAGLDTRIPYVQEKLGHKDIITWQDAIKRENTKFKV